MGSESIPLTVDQQSEVDRLRTESLPTRRPVAPALEEILYQAIPVLDHGFVRVIDYMGDAIVTTIEPDRTFYPAENYHQDFLTLNPTHPYIVFNDLPKVENLKHLFLDLYRAGPALVLSTPSSN